MKTHLEGICPLCGNPYLRIELQSHILAERAPLRHDTIKEIIARNPDWDPERGACRSCWETHRALSQSPRSATIFRSLG